MKLNQTLVAKGYGKLNIRPIRLDDEQEMVRFHQSASEDSIYMRYFEYLGLDRRTSHERLVRICTNTPESYAIVVERPAALRQPAAILAVGRLTKAPESDEAAFDTLIADEQHKRPVGKGLVERLVKLARAFGFHALTSELLVVDHDALNLCRALGFSLQTIPENGVVQVELKL